MPDQNLMLSLEQAYQNFTELILSLSDEQFLSSMDGWAPRDVVAHLVGWNNFMIEASLTVLDGQTPSYYEDAPNDFSTINARFTAKYASQSRQELLAQLKASLEKLETFLSTLSEEEQVADYGAVHYRGGPATVVRIINSLKDDYVHHTQQIQDWLNP